MSRSDTSADVTREEVEQGQDLTQRRGDAEGCRHVVIPVLSYERASDLQGQLAGQGVHAFIRIPSAEEKTDCVRQLAESDDGQSQIDRANERKISALKLLRRAHADLCEAQEQICDVVGTESAAIYDQIADAYMAVREVRHKLRVMQPMGLFESR